MLSASIASIVYQVNNLTFVFTHSETDVRRRRAVSSLPLFTPTKAMINSLQEKVC